MSQDIRNPTITELMNMPLHSVIGLDTLSAQYVRVPGGWLFNQWFTDYEDNKLNFTSVFIPQNNQLMMAKECVDCPNK